MTRKGDQNLVKSLKLVFKSHDFEAVSGSEVLILTTDDSYARTDCEATALCSQSQITEFEAFCES